MEERKSLLYIEDEDKNEAQFMSRSFVEEGLKNRVYLNALGSELVTRYLNSEGIDTSGIHNMHSISKIIETIDISDILLPNIHIDVRVIFDEDQIFVPISHFELGLVPDVYVVLKLDSDFNSMELLGYFTPKQINKSNKNIKYYFVEKEKLSSEETLVSFVRNFTGNTSKGISQDEMLKGRSLSISLADHDISEADKKELLSLLLASSELRESVLEFDNFETLSYNVAALPKENIQASVAAVELEEPELELSEDSSEELFENEIESDLSEESEEEPQQEQEETDNNNDDDEEEEEDKNIEEIRDILVSDDNIEVTQDTLLPDLNVVIDDISENIEIDSEISKEADVSEILSDGIETAAEIATAGLASMAAGSEAGIAAEGIAAAAVTNEAIDLASMAGDLANNFVDLPQENDEEHLQDFSLVEQKAFDEKEEQAKKQDDFNTPKDLSEFKQVENFGADINDIEHEVVDIHNMEQVELEEIPEIDTDHGNLTDLSEFSPKDDEDNVFNFDGDMNNETETSVIEDDILEITSNEEDDDEGEEEEENVFVINEPEDEENTEEILDESEFFEDSISDSVEDISDELDFTKEDEDEDLKAFDDEIDNTDGSSEETDTAEEWISDTNYDDLEDVEQPSSQDQDDIDFSEFTSNIDKKLEEPKIIENSAVISDKNFVVGEIVIDINKPEELHFDGPEHLENLYNENNTLPGGALLGGTNVNKPAGLGIIGILISLIIVGIIGFSVTKMIRPASEETQEPITDTALPVENTSANSNTLNVNEGNVVKMDNTNTSPIAPSAVEHKNQPQSQNVATSQQSSKKLSPTQFIEVSRLSWEAPNYVSADQSFRQYFQSAGKSLKLSLSSDLLLANEYVYSDQVRVSVNFAQDGTLKDAKILLSSGSQQVDKIVLQTVNQTLKVLKAPHSVGNDQGTTVILKIYF